ncbi:YgfZ/GcvT domain-containing protein [Thioalkalivibrio sulfidiphilus]|uniref:Glycine cleavage T protein (Aminomethyl transferase) n=1 Tax=Thioalkalivibrio sulfidiphilus (strain HL-EbGR7) TaxID=396588 RepID=B8GRJ4_THISH|nr:folate-binding protein YgfZ [Thioalkalivibrio sulfidiphilus]ACL72548.1 glycine cleavage T protein (aminomethyl transferase) [Thioalkalivibrio sulfidiphilus HL-EbGr7]
MKPEWKDFLVDAGAEFDNGSVADFGNAERERRVVVSGDVICDLSHQGLIVAYGEEAGSFLQGQFSNDVLGLASAHSHLNSYCTPKGRMLANFRVFRRGESYYLRMPRAMVESVLKRLRMFVLRSKVTLEDADDALVRIGLSGPRAVEELQTALGDVPSAVNDVLHHNDITAIRVPGPHPRFELYGELEAMKQLWNKLNVRCAPVGAGPWALLDILAGIPNVTPATSEAFVPQMANMQLIGGVSFKKGCYPGQEVVARMHYLGKLKRRMYRVTIDTDQPPAPGTEILGAGGGETEEDQAAGRIVDAQLHPDGKVMALAVLQIAAAEAGGLHLAGEKHPAVSLETLPYSFEMAAAS